MPVLLLVLLVLAILVAFWLTFNILGILLTLLIAGVVGYLADVIVPGRLPYGWLGAILAGLVGSWIGGLLPIVNVGPSLAGIRIIPAIFGAIIVAFLVEIIAKSSSRRS